MSPPHTPGNRCDLFPYFPIPSTAQCPKNQTPTQNYLGSGHETVWLKNDKVKTETNVVIFKYQYYYFFRPQKRVLFYWSALAEKWPSWNGWQCQEFGETRQINGGLGEPIVNWAKRPRGLGVSRGSMEKSIAGDALSAMP